jgi:mRNA-degrading endonuclease toxin of MazEF toxin-antitoxin module
MQYHNSNSSLTAHQGTSGRDGGGGLGSQQRRSQDNPEKCRCVVISSDQFEKHLLISLMLVIPRRQVAIRSAAVHLERLAQRPRLLVFILRHTVL